MGRRPNACRARIEVAFVRELATGRAAGGSTDPAAPCADTAARQEGNACCVEPLATGARSAPLPEPQPVVEPVPRAGCRDAARRSPKRRRRRRRMEPTALASAPPADAAPAAATASSAAAFEWPPSTRLSYVLVGNYRGEVRRQRAGRMGALGRALSGASGRDHRPEVRPAPDAAHDAATASWARTAWRRAATTS